MSVGFWTRTLRGSVRVMAAAATCSCNLALVATKLATQSLSLWFSSPIGTRAHMTHNSQAVVACTHMGKGLAPRVARGPPLTLP